MESLFRFFSTRHKLAWMGTLLVMGLGIATLTGINRSQYPSVDMDQVVVITHYPGASSEDVELNVTCKIEDELNGVTGIKRMESTSSENVSFVMIQLDSDLRDTQKVKDEIREAVGRVSEFPDEVDESPRIMEIKTAIFPIIEVGLVGDIPYAELRERARIFENKLKAIKGVSGTKRYGYLDREIKIEIIPAKLSEYQISIAEIIAAIRLRNIRLTGGTLESYTSERNVVTLAQFRDPKEVEEVVIRGTYQGPLVKVKDVAVVHDGFEDATIRSRLNGRPAISFIVEKSENADILRTTERIKQLMQEQAEFLPEGVEFATRYDISRNTRNQFDIVVTNGFMGLALVFIVLTIFLNWRISIWVAMGIPVSILGTICMLPLFGIHLDSITLTAMVIVVGIVVDDSIIIVENIHRRRELGDSPVDAAVAGLSEVWMPVLTTVLTTFLAFAPMLFMPGMMGKFVVVIPITVSLALFISILESFFALPAHMSPSLRSIVSNRDKKRRAHFESVVAAFSRGLDVVLRMRYAVVICFAVVLAASVYYASQRMTFILFPSQAADRFYGRVELQNGSSLKATGDVMTRCEAIIENLPKGEVASYGSRIGAFADLVDNEKENYATIMVDLSPFSERSRTADEIVAEVRERASKIGGVKSINFEIDTGGPPTGRPVTIRVVGSDDKMRHAAANKVFSELQGIDGVVDVERDDRSGKEQIELVIDYEALARMLLNVATVANNVRIAYDGEVVTSVRYGSEDVDFRVTLPSEDRESISDLEDLPIPNAQGRLIKLSQVAGLKAGPGPSSFQHYDSERSITITADVVQGKITAQRATLAAISRTDVDQEFPGVRLITGGEAQEMDESMQGLLTAFICGVVGIYFLLVLLFNSFAQPLLVLIAVPFGLAGVIITFALHDKPLSFLAMIGTVGLLGVVVNDSLVLVDKLNHITRNAGASSIRDLVVQGTASRFRAIILTTLTTVCGLLPLAYGIGGADAYMGPMALALGYGILFATPLTLILLPSLYLISRDIPGIFTKLANATTTLAGMLRKAKVKKQKQERG